MRLGVLLLAASAASGFGQLRSVEMGVSGLDCASCSESVTRAIGRIRGVEKAELRGTKVIVRLSPGNKVTLGRLRDALKGMGYTPESANIEVKGDVQKNGTVWLLQSPAGTFELSPGDLPQAGEATLTGVVRPPQRPGETEKLEVR